MARIADEQKKNSEWQVRILSRPKISSSLLIAGLPGIGNVGKIVLDVLIEELKAKKIAEFSSYDMPAAVYVREDHLVRPPIIELYHVRKGKQDILLLTGDAQPTSDRAVYTLCDEVVSLCSPYGCTLVMTTGGIGLEHVPEHADVFCSGTKKETVRTFVKGTNADHRLYGVVGPIMGVTGVLLDAAQRNSIPAVTVLAQTFGHPLYLGLPAARAILALLDKKYGLKIQFKDIDNEIARMDAEAAGESDVKTSKKFKKAYKALHAAEQHATNYIG